MKTLYLVLDPALWRDRGMVEAGAASGRRRRDAVELCRRRDGLCDTDQAQPRACRRFQGLAALIGASPVLTVGGLALHHVG